MRTWHCLKSRDERGSILLAGLMLVFVMTILGFALFDLTVLESRLVIDRHTRTQACYASEVGLNRLWQEMGDGDGINDFSQVNLLTDPTDVYINAGFTTNNGPYTYTVTKLESLAGPPPRLRARATGTSPPTVTSPTGVQCVIAAFFSRVIGFQNALSSPNSLTIGGGPNTLVDSYIGSYNPSAPGNNGDVESNGTLTISGNTTILGDTVAGGTVTFPPVLPCGPPYYDNSLGKITGVFDYTPAVGDLEVKPGKSANLANWTYCFKSVTVKGSLTVSGPVVVYLTGSGDTTGGAIINTTLCAANLQILSSGGPSSGDAIKITGGTETYLTLYAPGAQVDVSGGGEIFGAIVGYTVTVHGGSSIHFDEALANGTVTCPGAPPPPPITLLGGTVGFKRDSWALVQN